MNDNATIAPGVDAGVLEEVLRHALDGIAVVESRDGVTMVTYGNATLAALLRRSDDWVAGRRLEEVEVEAPADPTLTATGIGSRVRLKRVDGTLVDCERWAVMLAGSRIALYYRPVPRTSPGVLAAALERSSGLSTEEQLVEMLGRDWSIGQRDGRCVTLMHFEIDSWPEYLEIFGRSASDNLLRQVGRTIASIMKRASDVVARSGGGGFLVLGVAMDADAAHAFADQIVARIRSLALHHPRSSTGRFLTVSAGVVTAQPPRGISHRTIVEASHAAVAQAKARGGNCAVRGEL
ncbi:MAG: GGDEF domain-containing protein [Gammaproteobacteria bacterium]|nr:GGDEF domain-containing protein [Gammaproteobacteria bacterium]MDH5176166.1 GGDEF domain-containing protein [Gammaproteobacteria bacterium]